MTFYIYEFILLICLFLYFNVGHVCILFLAEDDLFTFFHCCITEQRMRAFKFFFFWLPSPPTCPFISFLVC